MKQDSLQVALGARIVRFRKDRGVSQEKLADASGISRNSLSDIELGKTDIRLNTARRIAAALQCTMSELMPDHRSNGEDQVQIELEMSQYELLHHIATSGANLVISKPMAYQQLHDLAVIAKSSGSKLTLSLKNLTEKDVTNLCVVARKSVTFVL